MEALMRLAPCLMRSESHSKKWRAAGSYLPSKLSGLTGRGLLSVTKNMIGHHANRSAPTCRFNATGRLRSRSSIIDGEAVADQ
jgi:hypothetical protein